MYRRMCKLKLRLHTRGNRIRNVDNHFIINENDLTLILNTNTVHMLEYIN